MSARSAQRALFILLVASIVLVAVVLEPLAIGLFLAGVLAAALWPLQRRLTKLFRGHDRIAAGLLVCAVIALVLGPLIGLSAFLVKEAAEAWRFVFETIQSEGMLGLIERLPGPAERLARRLLTLLPAQQGAELSETVREQVSARGGEAATAVGTFVAATGSLVFQTVMMLIGLFFFLTQKEAVLDWIEEASPLGEGQTREILAELRGVTGAVLRSSILTALVQATAALIGYIIARVPVAFFFAAITFFFALVPAVGAAGIVVLTAGLMYLTGHPVAALFLVAWGLLVVGLVDNLLKPWLIKGGVGLHGAVVFFSLLGGLAAFGAIGLLVGPLAVALFVAILRIYRRDYGDEPPRPRPDAGARGEPRDEPLVPSQPQTAMGR